MFDQLICGTFGLLGPESCLVSGLTEAPGRVVTVLWFEVGGYEEWTQFGVGG